MLAQLAIAFPERSQAEREAIAKASLVHLAWLAAEVVTVPRWRARLPEYVGLAPGAELRVRVSSRKSRLYHTGAVAERVAEGVRARVNVSAVNET